MKFKIFVILIVTTVFLGCKKDTKEPVVVPENIIVKDSVPLLKDIDSIIEDSIIIEEPVIIPTKPVKKKSVAKPKKAVPTSKNSYTKNDIKFTPIEHATLVIEFNNTIIYVDPVGGKEAFKNFKSPNFILITDIHGDHLDTETLEAINTPNTQIIGPKAVKAKLSADLLKNYNTIFSGISRGFSTSKMSLDVEGVAMYNIRPEAKKYHPQSRGVGYILSLNNKRIYISGDTEDTFEMRHLKNIDMAFVCMNLPYTMSVESAASAVLDFKPKQVFPYHYKGTGGFSDVKKFKTLVNRSNKSIEVVQLDWY
ncbi:MBL fold metallo-hydrolase [Xanthomarina sp. GH4-25]|uniref:MBL fold metallo-hydrolase n=1 Tax=Xanthomarina sp. GH4-25 TaxID=3349335 RepID=UPI003878229B